MAASELRAHQEWLGYLQPVGLVVSPPALVQAQCFPNRNIVEQQQALVDLLDPDDPCIRDFPRFTREFLGWEPGDLVDAVPDALEVALPEYGETLRPTYAVPDPDSAGSWLLLVVVRPRTEDLDATTGDERHWQASPQARCERLLRETGVPIGLLCNGVSVRLVHAPKGESSGHVTFPVSAMAEVAGRPIVAALHMLLAADRLFTLPSKQRLPALLRDSRKYQNEVSTKLAGQVLAALHELLRGFQAADAHSKGALLGDVMREEPQEVYGGLVGTLLRLVFILYAEDRGLLGTDAVYQAHYSLAGLFERLRDDEARYPDTMDQRHGAWARLLTLFRLVHDGAAHGSLRLPPRRGRLFDPDTYDFLEGRPWRSDRTHPDERLEPPRVSDGVVLRVLENLLVLDGDRISYRALDVEQIGSVYEAIMGFEVQRAAGVSIGVRPHDVVVDLDALLSAKPAERAKRLKDEAGCDLAGAALERLKAAATPEDVVAALGRKVSPRTPHLIPAGGLVLQPTQERRRSGSHYTPRSLTAPIVQTALAPVPAALGENPTPAQILGLSVCDPAMGSGAFLVETCRFLGDALVRAWAAHGETPAVPPDEDVVLFARRQVAARCLYGVDRNPFAVELAKLSLWLVTLARDHPFTFLDHALRPGDSLVGLGREQIASFHWKPDRQLPLIRRYLDGQLKLVEKLRADLHALGDEGDEIEKARLHREAQRELSTVRLCADLVVAAFFAKGKDKEREAERQRYADLILAVLEDRADSGLLDGVRRGLAEGAHPVTPFHWEVEFPEVFAPASAPASASAEAGTPGRRRPGFDAIVGNPPFAGKNTLIAGTREAYPAWLKVVHEESHGAADLVAHFFRRAFGLLREGGCLGLIATNTIAQGDTRGTGLRWICHHGGTIYSATRRVKWPGMAAVVVSVVHVARGAAPRPFLLDGREVPRITAFLFHDGGHDDPARLRANADKSFQGSIVLGMGFTFDDDNPDATPIAEMHRLIEKDPRNAERIFPYIGGEEVNDSPTHAHRRYVINFGEMSEGEARGWPDLMAIVEAKVRPERLTNNRESYRRWWWQYAEKRGELVQAIRGLDRVLVAPLIGRNLNFVWLPSGIVYSHKLAAFAHAQSAAFAVLQGRAHERWAWFFSSTMKDDLNYSPSDCFETFPFPPGWETDPTLESIGDRYHAFRADLMVRTGQGLTRTYNRFHDPAELDDSIAQLRRLHDDMDRAVLDAYGWTDIRPTCDFVLDYTDDSEDEEQGRRKKPWRYRWPDDVRDEVLARLLALNQQRAEEERLSGTAADKATKAKPKAAATKGRAPSGSGSLF